MGVGGGIRRAPGATSHVAYYVALGAIVILLFMLCVYFFYFFVRKVKELRQVDSLSPTPAPVPCRPPPVAAAYPVQPVVRDSASAMARLCKQLPAPLPAGGKGGTVFPAPASPAAQQTDTGPSAAPPPPPRPPSPPPGKAPPAGPVTTAAGTLAT